jgi:ABC-type polysaccharide/polyol phosphate transport system ATPase subunit
MHKAKSVAQIFKLSQVMRGNYNGCIIVCHLFGKVNAVDNMTVNIPNGAVVGLVGSNGSGKSTLLRMLAGVYAPDGGTVKVDGIIAIASVCTGTLLLPQVTNMYVNFIVGTLACISAYGFLSACCGTTFNTVLFSNFFWIFFFFII